MKISLQIMLSARQNTNSLTQNNLIYDVKMYFLKYLSKPHMATDAAHLLNHLRVLLHYVKEAVTLLGHGRRSFLCAA